MGVCTYMGGMRSPGEALTDPHRQIVFCDETARPLGRALVFRVRKVGVEGC